MALCSVQTGFKGTEPSVITSLPKEKGVKDGWWGLASHFELDNLSRLLRFLFLIERVQIHQESLLLIYHIPFVILLTYSTNSIPCLKYQRKEVGRPGVIGDELLVCGILRTGKPKGH